LRRAHAGSGGGRVSVLVAPPRKRRWTVIGVLSWSKTFSEVSGDLGGGVPVRNFVGQASRSRANHRTRVCVMRSPPGGQPRTEMRMAIPVSSVVGHRASEGWPAG
jgi:hypothetical protein